MHRRRYLVLASTVLVAGCQSDGDDVTPTTTGTDSDTATATATETATQTPTQTETETETPTETETEAEPSVHQRIREARRDATRAHDLFLEQGGGADSITAIGPATRGFDEEPIRDALAESTDHLDRAAGDADDDQQTTIDELRTATEWLRTAARMQANMSTLTGEIEAAGTAAADRADLATIVDSLEVARRSARTVRGLKPDLDRPGPRPFMQVDGLGRDTVYEKHDQLHREAVGVGTLADILADTITQVERLGQARGLIPEDPDEAERIADRAERDLGTLRSRVRNINVDSLGPIIELYRSTVAELQAYADDVVEEARDA